MTEYFIIEKNPLNTEWMVYSKCEQLSHHCFHGTKSEMDKLKDKLNEQCIKDLPSVTFELTWKD